MRLPLTILGSLLLAAIPCAVLADDIGPELPTFGKGFNSLAQIVKGECVLSTTINIDNRTQDWSDFVVITSAEALRKSLALSAGASFGFGLYSGDARYSLYDQSNFNHYSSYLLVRVEVRKKLETLANRQLTSPAYWAAHWGALELFKRCGYKYLAQRQTGGLFYALLEIESSSEQDRKSIDGAFNAAAGPWGSANASIVQSTISRVSSRKVHYHIEKLGLPEANPDLAIDKVIQFGRQFPAKIYALSDANATPVEYQSNDWSTLGYASVGAAQADLIGRYQQLYGRAMSLENDLSYITTADHFDWFSSVAIGAARSEQPQVAALKESILQAAKDCAQYPDKTCVDPNQFTIPNYQLPRRPYWVKIDPVRDVFQPVDIVLPGETRHLEVKGTWCIRPPCSDPRNITTMQQNSAYQFIGDDGQIITDLTQGPSGSIVFMKPGRVFVKVADSDKAYYDNQSTPEGAWASVW